MNPGSLASWVTERGNDQWLWTLTTSRKLIRDGIPDAKVTIRDLAGDGDHYAAEVVAESFRGKTRVQQHQMVYNALKGNMGGVLHALALQTSRAGLTVGS